MSSPEPVREHKNKGDVLKKAREAQGVSLETVHEVTKIPLDVLRAIEEGYTVGTLSPFYQKAFMKKYAQYLDVDVSAVVEDYHKEQLPEHIQPVSEEEKNKFRPEKILNRQQQQVAIKIAAVLVALFFVGKFVGCVAEKLRRPRPDRSERVEVRSPQTTERKSETAPQPKKEDKTKDDKKKDEQAAVVETRAAAPQPAPGSPATRPATDKVRLTVQATKSTWLQVKTDGNTVFQSSLDKGVSETWQAAENIELTGKDIHTLEMEVNGKNMGTLGRGDRNARRIVVTADGLSVKK